MSIQKLDTGHNNSAGEGLVGDTMMTEEKLDETVTKPTNLTKHSDHPVDRPL